MHCVTHIEREAVDVCRSCGKPICASCEDRAEGPCLCGACCPAPAPAARGVEAPPAAPATATGPARSPLLAGLLSMLPGMGQLYNGDLLKALAVMAVTGTLIFATSRSPVLGPFLGFFWLFQVCEAWIRARGPRPAAAAPAPAGGSPPLAALGLAIAGLLLLVENFSGLLQRFGAYLVPAAVILTGVALLLSYFRAAPEAHS